MTLTARWKAHEYTVKYVSSGTGYTITVERTASSEPSAKIGTLYSGEQIYHGDILKITYTAKDGYAIATKGATSITVSGNVTSSNIYATATRTQISLQMKNILVRTDSTSDMFTVSFTDYFDLEKLKSLGYTKVTVKQNFDARLTSNNKGYVISKIVFNDLVGAIWSNSPSDIVAGTPYTNIYNLQSDTSIEWTNTREFGDYTFINIYHETYNPWSIFGPTIITNNYYADHDLVNYTLTITFEK